MQVQRVCDATLQLIGEISPEWSQKLMAEKFRFHNAQWLEMVQSHSLEELNSAYYQVTLYLTHWTVGYDRWLSGRGGRG